MTTTADVTAQQFMRANLYSRVVDCGISKSGRHYWYKLADGQRYRLTAAEVAKFERQRFRPLLSPELKAQADSHA